MRTKHRVCTTISGKHWELLKRYTAKYVTQQKALEAALETLEENRNQNELSPEDLLWIRGKDVRSNLCVIHKEIMRVLMRTADFEQLRKVITGMKMSEYQVVLYNHKPLKECTLKEVIDGIVYSLRIVNLFDTINYTDGGNFYSLEAVHTLGPGNMDASNSFKFFFQDLFETYGARIDCKISENSIFMKIYKN